MKLSICACVKNEGPYIEEWIEHHVLQGVEHFYLFNNDSTDDTAERLALYEKEGIVSMFPIQGQRMQQKAYKCAIKWKIIESEWCAFIDVDEFLFNPAFYKLTTLLEEYKDTSAVTAHWVFFGSNHMLEHSPELVTARFFRRAHDIDQHCKSIVRVRDLLTIGGDVHTFKVRGKIRNEHGVVLQEPYARSLYPSADLLRINHYHTKSRGEAFTRWKLPRADNGGNRATEEHFAAHDRNEVVDLLLSDRAPIVKAAIDARRKQWKIAS